ncbi:MAG: hypothetical protein GY739_19245 [Mesoflavibacter sp.]|nr:hypothetical protein [Mesoflavibacter sp.]
MTNEKVKVNMEIKKLTEMDLESHIDSTKTEFIHRETLTICILTLHNGFKVVGKSACMNMEDYNKDVGEAMALGDATNNIWEPLGFHLKQSKYKQENK